MSKKIKTVYDIFAELAEFVQNWLEMDEFPDLGFTWGVKRKKIIDDPLQFAEIKKMKVVLGDMKPNEPIWKIHALRGIIFFILDHAKQNKTVIWNFATLCAISIIPNKYTTRVIKSNFLKLWKKCVATHQSKLVKYDFFRLYSIFSSFNSIMVTNLLSTFITKVYSPESEGIELQLNKYIITSLPVADSIQDLKYIVTCLRYQTLIPKEIREFLPEYSQHKLYESKKRLTYQINKYLIHFMSRNGLQKLYIKGYDKDIENKLQQNNYYEHFEYFFRSSGNFIKYRIPSTYVSRLLDSVNLFYPQIQLFLVVPDSVKISTSPEMYNIEDHSWYSVYDFDADVQSFSERKLMQETAVEDNEEITKDELTILLQILQNRDDNPMNNVYNYSRSRTKQIIRKIQRKGLYSKRIILSKPSKLPTLVCFLPISRYMLNDFEHENINNTEYQYSLVDRSIHRLTESTNISRSTRSTINEIEGYSWPYLVSEYVLHIVFDDLAAAWIIELGIIYRITAMAIDLLKLVSINTKLIFLGIHKYPTGTVYTFPLDYFNNGKWEFPLDEIVEVLKMKR